jgi:hypothetical protein
MIFMATWTKAAQWDLGRLVLVYEGPYEIYVSSGVCESFLVHSFCVYVAISGRYVPLKADCHLGEENRSFTKVANERSEKFGPNTHTNRGTCPDVGL